jgi:hypothetical protein
VEIEPEAAASMLQLGVSTCSGTSFPETILGALSKKDLGIDFVNNNPSAFSDAFLSCLGSRFIAYDNYGITILAVVHKLGAKGAVNPVLHVL